MKMNEYFKLEAELRCLERRQYIAFSAACAERVVPILRNFGSLESVAVYDQALEMAWLGVTRHDLAAQAEQLIEKIENSPEAEENVEYPAHFAGEASYLLTLALEAIVK